MTREEAQDGDMDIWCQNRIDGIYDDFEGRICENCDFYVTDEYMTNGSMYCYEINIKPKSKTFGCTEFKGFEL